MNRRYSIFAGSAVAALVLTLSAAAQQFEFAQPAAPAAPAQPAQPPAAASPFQIPPTAPPAAQISGGSLTLSAGRGRAMIAGPSAGISVPDGVVGFHAVLDDQDPEMEKINRSVHELEQQSHELMRKYAETDDAALQEKAKAQLRDMLAKQFDLQNQRRALELTRIEERLGKLRDQFKRRTDARDQIVDQRLQQLVSEAEGLGWTGPGSSNPLEPKGFLRSFRSTRPAPAPR